MNNIKKIQNRNRGQVAIILSIMILSMLLAIALGISTLLVQQLQLTRDMGDSVIAFYAADSGAEKCLYDIWNGKTGATSCYIDDNHGRTVTQTLQANPLIQFTVTFNAPGNIQSRGDYKSTSRKLDLNF